MFPRLFHQPSISGNIRNIQVQFNSITVSLHVELIDLANLFWPKPSKDTPSLNGPTPHLPLQQWQSVVQEPWYSPAPREGSCECSMNSKILLGVKGIRLNIEDAMKPNCAFSARRLSLPEKKRAQHFTCHLKRPTTRCPSKRLFRKMGDNARTVTPRSLR